MTLGLFFPGQGAQAVGMGKAFYDASDAAKAVYKRANARLSFDVAALCFEGPQEELTKTERCQVALLVTSLAAYEAYREAAPSMQAVAATGLSLGEWSALTAAKALAFEDALYLVQARGEAMAQCAAQQGGAMLAIIGMNRDALDAVCQQSGARGANYNAPDQVVLSGTVAAIEKAQELAKAAGAKRAMKLDVAGAFHSPLMEPAAKAMERVLAKAEIRPPTIPVISNVTGAPVQDPQEIRRLLVAQITSPVQWDASVRQMVQMGAKTFVEFPPARVLTALLRRIDPAASGVALNEPKDFEQLP